MHIGDYIYYKDFINEYILEVKEIRHGLGHEVEIVIDILACSNKHLPNRIAIWDSIIMLKDCFEMKVLTEPEALAMVL